MLPGLGLMTFVVVLLVGQVDWLTPGSFTVRLMLLGTAVVAGGLIYVASLWLLGVKEMRQAWTMIANRFSLPFRQR
jgi:hypothetical protein